MSNPFHPLSDRGPEASALSRSPGRMVEDHPVELTRLSSRDQSRPGRAPRTTQGAPDGAAASPDATARPRPGRRALRRPRSSRRRRAPRSGRPGPTVADAWWCSVLTPRDVRPSHGGERARRVDLDVVDELVVAADLEVLVARAGRSVPPSATFSTWDPRQIASVGTSRSTAVRHSAMSRASRDAIDAGRPRVDLVCAVARGVDVAAAGHEQGVDALEQSGRVVRVHARQQHRDAAGLPDGLHVRDADDLVERLDVAVADERSGAQRSR